MEGSGYQVDAKVMVTGVGPGEVREINEDGTYEVQIDGNGIQSEVPETSLTPSVASETPQDPPEGTKVTEPPSVFEDLGRAYARSTEDRRETFPILPGRFNGNLAMRARPIDPQKRKKKVRRIAKTGITDEAEARYAAEIIAEACETILVRLNDGTDPIPAHEVPQSGLGEEPVRFEQRLGKVVPSLGEILNGDESPAAIVRLLFKNLDALDGFYVELDQWLKEASPTEEDEEGEETRPS